MAREELRILTRKRETKPLRDKIRGPNALPVGELISRAEIRIAPLHAQYRSFAQSRVASLEQLLDILTNEPIQPNWDNLVCAVHDLRSSSATFGAITISKVAGAWENMLGSSHRNSQGFFLAMRIHLESLKLDLRKELSAGEADAVEAGLVRLVKRLSIA